LAVPKPRTAPHSEKLLGIQMARGMAATLVVLYHCGRMLPPYTSYVPFGGFFKFGHAGVDFFFTLSGFIIYYVHYADIGKPSRLRRYGWRRVARIYPMYWFVTGLLLAKNLAESRTYDVPLGHLIQSLLLIPHSSEPMLGGAWTLVHEMTFYCVFAIAVFNKRIGIAVALLWIGMICAGTVVPFDGLYTQFIATFYHLQFLIGVLAAHIVLTRIVPWPRLWAAAGAAAFLASGLMENAGVFAVSGHVSELCFGLSAGLCIVGLATAERQGLIRIGRFGEFFGAASYSLYLTHLITIGIIFRGLQIVGGFALLPGLLIYVLAAAVAIVVGCGFCYAVEMPLITAAGWLGRNYVYGRGSPAPSSAA
jgi:exopolysaccharide production protein ExoZ